MELYALSIIPQAVGFDESGYEHLRDALFEGFSWETTVDTKFLETFGKFLQAMRFTCDDLGDTSSAQDNLKGLVSVLCDEVSITFDTTIVAGYQTSYDVSEIARIDLDILQIDLFMRVNAFDLALDVYRNGRNSRVTNTKLLSLFELATGGITKSAGALFEAFGDFFLTDTYSDRVVVQAISDPEGSRFFGSSRRQRAEAVRRALQTMVIYIQVVARLRLGVELCTGKKTTESPSEKVDEAVALFVGSIEGPFSGGSVGKAGQSFYSIGKAYCSYFNTCESHGDADANVRLQFSFSNMKEAFDDGKCNAAERILEDTVLPLLLVPLVQGVLFYAHVNDDSQPLSVSQNLTAGDMFAEALLPQIAKVNETAAAIVFENMDFEFGEPSVRSGKDVVFNAMSSVARGLGMDCASVGVLQPIGLGICGAVGPDGVPSSHDPDTPVSLGQDLYMATTNVQDRADIALDIKQMEESLLIGHVWSAKTIYMEGRNSMVYNSQGREVDIRALKKFSTNSMYKMARNPLYQITIHALSDDRGMYLGRAATMYADSVVKELFDSAEVGSNSTVAAEAALSLNLWMELVNELYQTVENCREGKLTDQDGIHSIDEAVAYWIGDGQLAGSGEEGHLFYAMAERMGRLFNMRNTGQSRTNANILQLFQQAKLEVSIAGACSSTNSLTSHRVRRAVDKLTSQMIAVHVQALIHALVQENNRDRVRVYSHVVVPLISACNKTNFEYLSHTLLAGNYKLLDVDAIVIAIRNALPCFGLQCEDIGTHSSERSESCAIGAPSSHLAEYKPTSDVAELARLDLDIAEIRILLEQGANEAAEELYSFGKHASLGLSSDGTALSLGYLATNAGRTIVPQLDSYRRFFENDDQYADTLVRKALASDFSSDQTSTVITACRVLIVYMAVLQFIYEAPSQCKATSSVERHNSASTRWDRAAAILIGSQEGASEAGSTEGNFLWGLSKRMCHEFDTCSQRTPGSSLINDRISTLLYAGRGAALDGNCDELRKVSQELSLLLRVPLMQAALSSAGKLSRSSLRERDALRAEAHVYSQALLPLIMDIDRRAAGVIQRNLPLQGHSLKDGLRSVLDAYVGTLHGLEIDCRDVGRSADVDACQGVVKAQRTDRLLIVMSITAAIILIAGIVTLIRVLRTRNRPENSPTFIRSQEGVLNHLSDLIPKKKKAAKREETTDWTEELTNACAPIINKRTKKDDEAYIQAIEEALGDSETDDENGPVEVAPKPKVV